MLRVREDCGCARGCIDRDVGIVICKRSAQVCIQLLLLAMCSHVISTVSVEECDAFSQAVVTLLQSMFTPLLVLRA
jgi:hypothetical protein